MQKIISTYSDNLFGKPFSMPQFIESSENDTLAHYNCENNNTNNECVFQNKLINFRDSSSHNLPVNQLTTEQILRRLTKVYGSLIRDLYHPIIFNSLGAETEYNSNLDTHGGIDLIVNGYVCCSYMGNKSKIEIKR